MPAVYEMIVKVKDRGVRVRAWIGLPNGPEDYTYAVCKRAEEQIERGLKEACVTFGGTEGTLKYLHKSNLPTVAKVVADFIEGANDVNWTCNAVEVTSKKVGGIYYPDWP